MSCSLAKCFTLSVSLLLTLRWVLANSWGSSSLQKCLGVHLQTSILSRGGGNLIPGMLVVSHKGVNYAVWSRSGQDANTFAPLPRHHASKTGALMSLTCLQDAGKSADED